MLKYLKAEREKNVHLGFWLHYKTISTIYPVNFPYGFRIIFLRILYAGNSKSRISTFLYRQNSNADSMMLAFFQRSTMSQFKLFPLNHVRTVPAGLVL